MNENNLTHFDAAGNAVMVDVSEKAVTFREAVAHGVITMNAEAFAAVQSGTVKKGDVVLIIESMKLMNEVTSDVEGVVQEILVKNGDAVEYDQPLMILA